MLPIYSPSILLAFGQGVLIPILPLYVNSFDVSYGLIGIVLASSGFGTLVGNIPAGILLSRISQRNVMVISVATIAFSLLAMSWAQSVYELILYGLLNGLGTALWNISRYLYITNAVVTEERGRAIASFGGVTRIGIFIGPFIGGWIASLYGLRSPFILCAVVAGLGMIFPWLYVSNSTPEAVQQSGSKSRWQGLYQFRDAFLETKQVLLAAGTGQLMAQMIREGRKFIVPIYAADVLGLDPQQIGLIVGLSSAIDMVLFYPAGLIMDGLGRKYAYVPCFLLQGIGMACIPFTDSFSGLLLATLLMGFGNGLGSGTMMTLGADIAPKKNVSEFLSVWRLIGDTGRTTSPIVIGAIADVLAFSPATFVIAAIGIGASAIFGLFVPETLKKKEQ